MEVAALGWLSPGGPLVPLRLDRRSVGATDVLLEVLVCGICHFNLTLATSDEAGPFPRVPGHEIVGRVVEVGPRVRDLKVGELAAVGWVTSACGDCEQCREGLAGACESAREPTVGGYSSHVVVDQQWVFRVPEGLAAAQVPPLLCAGTVLYTLFRACRTMPGDRVAVLGTGGVAELASKLAHALGAEVTRVDLEQLGELARGSDPRALLGRFDVVVSAKVGPSPGELTEEARWVAKLMRNRASVFLCDEPLSMPPVLGLCAERDGDQKQIHATPCPPRYTQEVLDLCAAQGVAVEVEMVSLRDIADVHARLKREPGRRLVADLRTLPGLESGARLES